MTLRGDIHIRVIYGHLGKFASGGLVDFAQRLRKMGFAVRDDIGFHYADNIAALLDADDHKRRVIIGFSMGANCISWISNRIKRPVDLGVAYDPSWGIPIIMPAHIEPVNPKLKRCIVYRGVGFPLGGARFEGPTVENINTGLTHLAVNHDPGLHMHTLQALERL